MHYSELSGAEQQSRIPGASDLIRLSTQQCLPHGKHVSARAKEVEHDADNGRRELDIHFLIRHETWYSKISLYLS
jgi:hypothetical protein